MTLARMPARCALFVGALILFAAVILPADAQLKSPTEDQCKQMTEQMLGIMRATPKQMEKERDRKSAESILERAEKLVKEGRAQRDRECVIWSALTKLVIHQ